MAEMYHTTIRHDLGQWLRCATPMVILLVDSALSFAKCGCKDLSCGGEERTANIYLFDVVLANEDRANRSSYA